MEHIKRIKDIINILNNASNAYYNVEPIMSDYEWDKLYEELEMLENESNIIYPDSPTQNVGYKVLDEVKEVKHNHLMLSLDKCHSEQELISFAKDQNCILSVKADGLTTSLHYIEGRLIGAETRGNGISGSDVLENVLNIKNVPRVIPYKDELIIDGETIIDWKTFKTINDKLPPGQEKYKHPRNLVSGTITMLNTNVASNRNMRFIAWRVIKGLNDKSVYLGLKEAEKLGFEIIPMCSYTNKLINKKNLSNILNDLQDKAYNRDIPYDGAVMTYDDIKYGDALGRTDKFFKHSIAYKYEDELYKTTLTDIEWNTSKTGLVNPIAVFNPVDLDGATTTRATLHNISYIEDLQLGVGDTIRIYRANMVIPKVHDNLTRSNTWKFPDKCPTCGGNVEIHQENGSKTLYCTNPECPAQLLGKLTHFVSRNAINIDGLSEQTLQKFIELGWVKSFKDIMHLKQYENRMIALEGFGKRSVQKLLDSIEAAKHTTFQRFLYSLSIPLIGKSASKDISKVCDSLDSFCSIIDSDGEYAFTSIDGFGTEMNKSLISWWKDNKDMCYELSKEFIFEGDDTSNGEYNNENIKNKTFCITGSLIQFKNRDELVKTIESMGGKVSGSVSSKTSYLICNEDSGSSKCKKAKDIGVPIISEEEFIKLIS